MILKNVFLNDKRREKRENLALTEIQTNDNISLAANQEAFQALQEVEAAFLKLTDEHREVLLVVAVEGLQYEEAAAIIGVNVGTVKSRLARARGALKAALETCELAPRANKADEQYG